MDEGVRKRSREEESLEAEVKKLRYFDILDTMDDVEADVGTEVSDLASLMKSFEEEIEVVEEEESGKAVVVEEEIELVCDLSTSEIGWLLEASDEDLGLPPSGDRKELPLPCFEPEEVIVDGWGLEPSEFGCSGGEWSGFEDLFGYEDVASEFGGFS